MAEFNLKSGNTTPFKMMGSSPAKQTEKKLPREHLGTNPIPTEAVSTRVALPTVPTIVGEPPHLMAKATSKSTGLNQWERELEARKKKKKKNILTSFTDFLKSKKTKQ